MALRIALIVIGYFIFMFRIIIGIILFFVKRPLLMDFTAIWIFTVYRLGFNYQNPPLECAVPILIGFGISAVLTFVMARIKYIGWVLLGILGVIWGYCVYDSVNGLLQSSVPQASVYIAYFAGFAFFLYHTYYGITQSNELFGEYKNPLYRKIKGRDDFDIVVSDDIDSQLESFKKGL